MLDAKEIALRLLKWSHSGGTEQDKDCGLGGDTIMRLLRELARVEAEWTALAPVHDKLLERAEKAEAALEREAATVTEACRQACMGEWIRADTTDGDIDEHGKSYNQGVTDCVAAIQRISLNGDRVYKSQIDNRIVHEFYELSLMRSDHKP